MTDHIPVIGHCERQTTFVLMSATEQIAGLENHHGLDSFATTVS